MKKVLLAEDDIDFANILKHYLELHDFEVVCAIDGSEALSLFSATVFDICVFDVMMPKMDGFALAEKCSKVNIEIPFIFLTAKTLKEDKIKGLSLGADDYIVKPFEADELVLRLNNILKRSHQKQFLVNNQAEIQIGSYILKTNRSELIFENQVQKLTEKEVALLVYLFENKNKLLKRSTILNAIWENDDFFSGRSMDVFISRLRKFLINDQSISIESTRNVGLEFKI